MVRQEIGVKIKLGLWFPEPAPVHPIQKAPFSFKEQITFEGYDYIVARTGNEKFFICKMKNCEGIEEDFSDPKLHIL